VSEIIRENGKIKAKIQNIGYGYEFLTMRNGFQWSGQGMTPELAKLSIEVLQEYLSSSKEEE